MTTHTWFAQDVNTIHDTVETIETVTAVLDYLKATESIAQYEGEVEMAYTIHKNIEKLQAKLDKAYAEQEKAYFNLLPLYL